MSDTPEGRVKKMIKRKLIAHFIFPADDDCFEDFTERVDGWFYMPSQNGMGVTGIPDFVGLYSPYGTDLPAAAWMIEAKASGGSLTANQQRRKNEVERLGCVHAVVSNEQEMDDFLETLLGSI